MADKVLASFNLAKAFLKLVGLGDGTNAIAVAVRGDEITAVPDLPPVSVTASTGIALAANTNRKNATFVNTGATDVYIRRGTPAVAGRGILLKASGGNYEINSTNLYKGVVTCITESGTSTLAVEEGV